MLDSPNLVTHFSKAYHVDKILGDRKVRFGPVNKLNDPRESSLSWIYTGGIGHEVSLEAKKEAEALKNSVGSKLRIFCACNSSRYSNLYPQSIENKPFGKPRMWAQYADNNRGFCILLDRFEFSTSASQQVLEDKHLIHGDVEYLSSLSHVSGGVWIEYGNGIDLSGDLFERINENRMISSIYLKKDLDWQDECEARWIIYSSSEDDTLVSIESSIKAVVLGYEFPHDETEKVINYCRELSCHCLKIAHYYQSYNYNVLYSPPGK